MTIALINKFDGGIAEDVRTRNQDQSTDSQGFDVYTNPHLLVPIPDSVAETVSGDTMANLQLGDVDVASFSGSQTLVSIGVASSSSALLTFYTKTNFNDTWAANASGASGYALVQGSLVSYKGKLYALGNSGSAYNLERFDGGGTVTSCGIISTTSGFSARPFVHPEDNILYIIIGNTITSWDGTTLTTTTTILPTGYTTSSVTNYGIYLAIAMNPLWGTGESVVYLWGRDATINTLQAVVSFGVGNIQVIENLYNTLFAVLISSGYPNTVTQNRIIVKSYAGGATDALITLQVPTSISILNLKRKYNNRLYFASSNDSAVYCLGKNQENQFIVTHDRYMNNGATVGAAYSISFVGDMMWFGSTNQTGTYSLMRSKGNALGESQTYTNTATYTTTINPAMGLTRYTIQDVHKIKQLGAVLIEYTGASSGTTKVEYICDGSATQTAISDTNVAGEIATESTKNVDGTEFLQGREFTFIITTTGGAKVKQVCYMYTPIETVL